MKRRLVGVYDDGSPQGSAPVDPRVPLHLAKGETGTVEVRVVTPAGTIVDLTNAVVTMMVRKRPGYQPIFKQDGVINRDAAIFSIDPYVTRKYEVGLYIYDVWCQLPNGDRAPVIPLSPFHLEPAMTTNPAVAPQQIELKTTDTEPFILDFSGQDITGWVITMRIGYPTTLVKTATITDGPNGLAQITWAPGDLIAGEWAGVLNIVRPPGYNTDSDPLILLITAPAVP